MTRTRYRFVGNDAPYFLTLAVVNWLPVFTRITPVSRGRCR
jgi:putative transposase